MEHTVVCGYWNLECGCTCALDERKEIESLKLELARAKAEGLSYAVSRDAHIDYVRQLTVLLKDVLVYFEQVREDCDYEEELIARIKAKLT